MGFSPGFLALTGRRCLVGGGDDVALLKARRIMVPARRVLQFVLNKVFDLENKDKR